MTVALDIQLEIGATSDTITVAGETPLLQTRTSDVSTLIESKTVQDLTLGDRRMLNIIHVWFGRARNGARRWHR